MRIMFLRVFLILLFLTVLFTVISYARGYRLDLKTKSLTSTGILATSSSPKAAKVYINDVLKGVTDLNLTLSPGEYKVEMKKEGYSDWTKTIKLKGEIVISLTSLLFSKNPSLSPVTSLGISKIVPIDQTDRMVLFSQNDDFEKDGIYIFEMNKRPISLLPPLKLILLKNTLPQTVSFKNPTVYFSPDNSQGIFEFETTAGRVAYLLTLDEENTRLFDIAPSKEALLTVWNEEKTSEITKIIEAFPKKVSRIATDSFQIVSFSPDETKVLYKAKKTVDLPLVIVPPLIGASQASEIRSLQTGKIYVYDRKEDKNFEITHSGIVPASTGNPNDILDTQLTRAIKWYSDSQHFIIKDKREIISIDYDGGNKQTVYSGPFEEDFFTVNNEGDLLILTNLNPQHNLLPDLYEIGIR